MHVEPDWRPIGPKDMKQGEVVIVQPPDYEGLYVTVEVRELRDDFVVFHAGKLNWSVICWIDQRGRILDDTHREVRTFAYEGEEL
jgi:hypothetical protein